MNHAEATALAHELPCELCGSTGTCVPAHYPRHTGAGGSKTKWDREKWIPLCGMPGRCHDLVDGRNGVGSQAGHRAWLQARIALSRKLGCFDPTLLKAAGAQKNTSGTATPGTPSERDSGPRRAS